MGGLGGVGGGGGRGEVIWRDAGEREGRESEMGLVLSVKRESKTIVERR